MLNFLKKCLLATILAPINLCKNLYNYFLSPPPSPPSPPKTKEERITAIEAHFAKLGLVLATQKKETTAKVPANRLSTASDSSLQSTPQQSTPQQSTPQQSTPPRRKRP